MRISYLEISALPLLLTIVSVAALAGTSVGAAVQRGSKASPTTTTLPAGLRPAFYKALAKDAGPAYRINRKGCVAPPKQGLKACFNTRGAHFRGAARPLSLHLAAWGRGAKLVPVVPTPPEINGSQVNYRHGALNEWWRVLPIGFEQGFTIAQRPNGQGELKLELAASRQGIDALKNGTLTWGKLRYGDLVVTDANGKVVPATLEHKGNRILIAVNDTHAAYPLIVDPLVWLEQKVSASDATSGDAFGFSLAVSGTTALVGAYGHNNYQGVVYVFSESDGVWSQTAELTASDGAAANGFGYAVALDGTTALIGARGHNNYQGTAYVFTESDGTWSQAAELTASDGATDDQFGRSVAISGTTALIGAYCAPYDPSTQNCGPGAAYVFTGSGSTWSQTAELTPGDGAAGDQFGYAAALADATALVGAIGRNSFQGAAYVFNESGGAWSQTAELAAIDGAAGDQFGNSIALDGTTALIGAPGVNVLQGAAYVFSESGGAWNQTAKLMASDGAILNLFGLEVALDDTTALVGSPYHGDDLQGAAYVFSESGGDWSQAAEITASDGAASDLFGGAVALAGMTALVGADLADVEGQEDQGAAYFEGESDLGLAVSAPQSVGQGQQYTSQTIATNNSTAATPAVSATMTVPAAASFVSATASQGSCSEASGVVTCDFGQITGNAGTATANVTLKATGAVGDTIENVAGIAKATPPQSASAPTTITAGAACPDGYTEYDGTLNPGEVARSPVYQAPGGSENAILTAPERFQLYAVYQSGRYGRHVYLVPGNEVHRWGPKGLYMWLVRARDGAGAYTLCLQHP